ncbi:unnamed protein product [Protopolystoma xenopodis]|uniref:Uncharacterized protein n=1 Tax=Protopolystoma xenopodis TaxID=117903 RepID=A0A3S5CQG6_9PLAT|nr:unnamed protein product [Protopolystoma xenopodis]
MVLRMAKLTEAANYDVGETSGNVPRLRSDFGNDYAYNGLLTSLTYRHQLRYCHWHCDCDRGVRLPPDIHHPSSNPVVRLKPRSSLDGQAYSDAKPFEAIYPFQ